MGPPDILLHFPQSIVVGSVYWGTPSPAAAGPLSVKWSVVVFVVAGSRSRSTLNLGVDFTQPLQYFSARVIEQKQSSVLD